MDNVLGNGSGFTSIDEFTDMSVVAIAGMCPTEMSAMLAHISEIAPQAFQLALAQLAGTPWENHDHEGDDDPETW